MQLSAMKVGQSKVVSTYKPATPHPSSGPVKEGHIYLGAKNSEEEKYDDMPHLVVAKKFFGPTSDKFTVAWKKELPNLEAAIDYVIITADKYNLSCDVTNKNKQRRFESRRSKSFHMTPITDTTEDGVGVYVMETKE